MQHRNPNDIFAFSRFDLTQRRGGDLYCIFVATVLHHCICQNCGNHIVQETIVDHMRKVLIPRLRKEYVGQLNFENLRNVENLRNERDFLWFLAGSITGDSYDQFWTFGLQHYKKDTYENTLLELMADNKKFFDEFNSPLN